MFSHEEEEARRSMSAAEDETVGWGNEPILDKRYALLQTLGEGRYAE